MNSFVWNRGKRDKSVVRLRLRLRAQKSLEAQTVETIARQANALTVILQALDVC